MGKRQVFAISVLAMLCGTAARATPQQTEAQLADLAALRNPILNNETIGDITFVGLRRIPPETVQAHITARVGQKFDREQIASDVRALGRLNWFATVRVEEQDRNEIADKSAAANGGAAGVRLAFIVEENPFP